MDQAARVRDALEDSDVFGSLTDQELDALIACGTIQRVPANRMVFQKGDAGDAMAVVLTGRVKISALSGEGREAVINFVEPGRCFGELALLDGKPRSADATAIEACELFLLKRRDLLAFLERRPEVALRIIGVLCARLRRTTEMMEDAVLLGMPSRVARGLLRLLHDYGRPVKGGMRIELKLSQRELGSYVGLARENVNRQLAVWRQENIVLLEDGHILVCDLPRLRGIAEGAG